jgi:LmbE family N-acetylglucosaminyl deacetylase
MANILFLFPHPDDETLLCGGTIARHAAAGDRAIWILASYGERSGHSKNRSPELFSWTYRILGYLKLGAPFQWVVAKILAVVKKGDKKLLETRKKEAREVSEILGVSEVVFLGIPDMRFDQEENRLQKEIKKYLDHYRPETIYTFHPDGMTGHPDHIALSRGVVRAVEEYDQGVKPKIFLAAITESAVRKFHLPLVGAKDSEISKEVILSETELERKIRAINAYKSQAYLWSWFLEKYPSLIEKEYFTELK